MSKAVLTTKVDPTYDDLPEQRYHFPHTYLRQVEAARGDWIVYYERRRPSGDLMKAGGKQAYFATARITDIIEDPSKAYHIYPLIDDFLPFDHPVPFKDTDNYYESGLRKDDGLTNKGVERAVRNIPVDEYDLILAAGSAHVLGRQGSFLLAVTPGRSATFAVSAISPREGVQGMTRRK